MTIAFVALGSNLGKRQTALRNALERMQLIPQTGVMAVATFRTTAPVDSPAGAAPFVNSAAQLETQLPADRLLEQLLRIELELGRTRQVDQPHAPRTIDLDLLLYGDLVLSTADVQIPHPRMHKRRFVLEPLAEIAPEAVHPVFRKTVAQLLAELPPEEASSASISPSFHRDPS